MRVSRETRGWRARRGRVASLLGLALLLALCLSGAARADLYWGNYEGGFGGLDEGGPSWIGHALLDGGDANAQFLDIEKENPLGLAADGSYLYGSFPDDEGGTIGRVTLAGKEPNAYFIVGPGGKEALDGVGQLAVTNEYVYWTNYIGKPESAPAAIGRAKINGTGVEPNFITLPEDDQPEGIAVEGNHIYWTTNNAIGRANVNGSEVDPDFLGGGTKSELGEEVKDIAVNSQYIYWRNFDKLEGETQFYDDIGRASINGGAPEPEWLRDTEPAGFEEDGLAINAKYIYWGTEGSHDTDQSIARAELSGGGENDSFIPDAGDVESITIDHRIVVNSNADYKDAEPSSGICAAKEHEELCTLRAAIETVNAAHSSNPLPVAVEIPGGKLETVTLKEELPKIESPIDLDARSQPGALEAGKRKIGLIVEGKGLSGAKANGLELGPEAKGSTIAGLQIQHLSGDGVLLEGESEQLADSILPFDNSGVEVAANNDTVGYGNGLPGDVFFHDGLVGLNKLLEEKKKFTASAYEGLADVLGEDVRLSKPSSGTHIEGNDIGVHGKPFEEAPDDLGADGFPEKWNLAQSFPIGVLIAPATSTTAISNVTIGGAGEAANVISGNLFGILAIGAEKAAASNISVLGNSFGDNTEGAPLEPLGNFFAILTGGPISGLHIGAPGEGNKFQGDLVGTLAAGTELTGLTVKSNTFGKSGPLGKVEKGLAGHEGFGLMLADAEGAQIGGGAAGEGNTFLGAIAGVTLLGKHLANDEISGNTIGTAPEKPFTTFANAPEEYSTIVGIMLAPSASASVPNLKIAGNTIQGALLGSLESNIKGLTMTSNTLENDVFGVLDVGSGGEQIGKPGEGNSFLDDGVGLFTGNTNPTTQEDEQATVNPKDSENKTREEFLSTPDANLADNVADDLTTAELSPTSANTSAAPGQANSIMGNHFGVSSGGVAKPDELPVLIAGDEDQLQFGGTGSGQGNVVEDNRSGGLIIGGTLDHYPTVQVLGNTFYNNENFTGTAPIPGLGINLVSEEGIGAGALGVDPQDPTQPDGGSNASQNSPVLEAAGAESGTLTITGSLHGVANTNYLIEVFADEAANPFGAGEGERHLGTLELTTNGSGNVAFNAGFADPGAAYRFVSSTATTVPGAGLPGVTSEFSIDAPIVRAAEPTPTVPSTPTTPTTPSTPPAKSTPSGAATTTVTTSGPSTVTTGSSAVTLPVKASCSSATSTPCTVTTTATVSAATASAAAVIAKAKKPVKIGSGSMSLAHGATAAVKLTLDKQGLALLKKHKTLAVTVTIKIAGGGRATVTRVLHLKLRYKKPASGKR